MNNQKAAVRCGDALRRVRRVASILMTLICMLVAPAANALGVDRYQASYEAIGAWKSSVPAAVEDLIRILETSVAASNCSTVQQPDGYTQRKCSYLDHETDGVHFRMLQVVDVVYRGNVTLHTETILGGTYEKRTAPVVDRIHGKPCNCRARAPMGNPIDPLTGAKLLREDLGLPSLAGQRLLVLYNTTARLPTNDPGLGFTEPSAASFGPLWSGSLHKRLVPQTTDWGQVLGMSVSRGDGEWTSFALQSSGSYQPDADVPDRLVAIAGGWRYIDMAARAEETYDTQGRVQTVAWLDGRRLNYTYSDASTPATVAPQSGLLIAVTDQNGRSAQFVYEQPAGVSEPRIRQITSGTDNTFIAYDSTGNLRTLTLPDGKTRQYLYERSDLPWAVTGVVDENNTRLATYGYDSEGRAIETQWAGGAQRYASSYDTAPGWTITETFDTSANIIWHDHYWVAPTGLRVTGPEGAVSEITTTQINGKVYLTGRSQPAGAGCSASTSSQDFDASGNLSRRDDFNGTRSCFSNDLQRGLVLATVEGLAQSQSCAAVTQPGASLPALSRLTSTEWHPDWPLPTRTAEPKLLTTNVYNGQPDPFNGNAPASCAPSTAALPDGKALPLLCLQRQQATLDTDGSKRFDLAGKPQVPGDANGVDPSYASVSLLLHLDGTLADSSASGAAASAFGNAVVNAGAARYGSGGLSLDGSYGSYVTASSAALDLGGDDFTVEAWVRLNAYGNFATLLSNYGNGGARGFDILTGSNGSVTTRWSQDGSSDAGSLWHANQIPLNTWAHVAVVRQGTALRIFLNGVPSTPVTINGAIFASSTPVNIGRTPDTGQGAWYLNGAVDDVRITKGVARYAAAFTPPTAGLPGKPVTPAVPSLFDATVADRVQRWTYDALGRVLTARGPRTAVNDTTTTEYYTDTTGDHTLGDRRTVTNAAGEVTTFNRYDKYGNVLQSTDANGNVALNTYDARQRLLTRSLGGETTTYTYDAVGQLTRITQVDGSWVGYEYDDAHRQVAVKDHLGNRIDYQLDNAGNKTRQIVKDPSGSLRRSMAQVLDALGRTQQTSGAE